MTEFLDIPGYEGYYKMNRLGQVVSLDRNVPHAGSGNKVKFRKGRAIPHRINSQGYVTVSLSKYGKGKHVKIHVLLGKMFIPNPNNYPIVRHLNDIKTDNRLDNLAWGTYKDNAQDSIKNGTFVKLNPQDISRWKKGKPSPKKGKCGERCPTSKLICDLQTGVFFFGCKEAAEAKNLNENTLRAKLCGLNKNNTSLIYV